MGKFKVGDRVVQDFTKDCCNLVEHWNDFWKRSEGTLFDDEFVITRVDRSYVTYSNRVGGSGPSIGEDYLKSAPLKIEAGKFYKTRDGRKVGPAFVTGSTTTFGEKENWSSAVWTDTGRQSTRSDTTMELANDIIAEWVDEPAVAVAPSNDNVAEQKFKVGDRVIVNAGYTFDGSPGVITEINVDDDVFYVKIDSHPHAGAKQWATVSSHLTLAPAPTNPAIVALIENGQPLPSRRPFIHADEASASKEAARLAGRHKGQSFGVYVLTQTVKEEVVYTYKHEWQRLAANGDKIPAIKALREITGLGLKATKDAVEHWIANDQQYSRIAA